jgi:hypothetical protein
LSNSLSAGAQAMKSEVATAAITTYNLVFIGYLLFAVLRGTGSIP